MQYAENEPNHVKNGIEQNEKEEEIKSGILSFKKSELE